MLRHTAAGAYFAGRAPRGIAAGDLDDDGDDDVVVASPVDGVVTVLRNDGTGLLMAPASYQATASELALGDIDGDGDLDIVTDTAIVLGNDGTGSFSLVGDFEGGFGPMVLLDHDRDGDLDLATRPPNSSSIKLLENDGNGVLAVVDTLTIPIGGAEILDLVTADLDGDRAPELIIGRSGIGTDSLMVFKNDGEGVYSGPFGHPSSGPRGLAVLDAEGDGDMDVAAILSSAKHTVYLNDGNGALTAGPEFGEGDVSITAADMNRDGATDLITTRTSVIVAFNDGEGAFDSRAGYRTQQLGRNVAIGQLDGDGRPDAVVSMTDDDIIKVVLSQGGDSLAVPGEVDLGLSDPHTIAGGDLDNDGDLDLAVADGDPTFNGGVDLLMNDGAGRFTVGDRLSTFDSNNVPVAVADLDGDGWNDIATANGAAELHLFFNQGGGSFPAFANEMRIDFSPIAIAVGDTDSDGDLDLVVAHISGVLSVIKNTGSRTFSQSALDSGGDSLTDLALADLDGDGRLDLITANSGPNTVSVLPGTSDGFDSPATQPVGADASAVLPADLDGDGDIDLLVPHGQGATLLFNQGGGAFDGVELETDAPSSAGAIGDLDGDGELDMVLVSELADRVTLFRNQGAGQFAPGPTHAAAQGPGAVIALHLDADCALDMAVGAIASHTAGVYLARP